MPRLRTIDLLPPLLYRRLRALRTPKRPGLNGIDSRLAGYLDVSRTGFFVELGANDGYAQSNTWFLEKEFGWGGVLIEPSPAEFIRLRQNRSSDNHFFCAACVSDDFADEFVRMRYSGLMTVTEGQTDLPDGTRAHSQRGRRFLPEGVQPFDFAAVARTLQSILDESGAPSDIDLLSLDVEGFELSVLRGVDHSRTRFGHVLVESRSPVELDRLLEAAGYEPVEALSHHDYLYRDGQQKVEIAGWTASWQRSGVVRRKHGFGGTWCC